MNPLTPPSRILLPLLGLVLAAAAHAAAIKFNIPAQPVSDALVAFSKQSGVDVLFRPPDLKPFTSPPLVGEFESSDAIQRLLADTGFEAVADHGKFLVQRAAAKAGSVSGTLLPARGGGSLAGVRMTVLETGATVGVNKNGGYKFPSVPSGTYTLVAGGEGFSRLRITDVVVRAGTDTILGAQEMPIVLKDGEVQVMKEVVVSAKKDIETLAAVEVSGERVKPFSTANVDLPRGINDVQAYYVFEARKIQDSGVANIQDFLQKSVTMNTVNRPPGATWASTFGTQSQVNLNGLGTNQTLVLIDGRRIPSSQEFSTQVQGNINGIPLDQIDRIEVLPTSASAIYGGSATGGVINIILKKDFQGGSFRYMYDSPVHGSAPNSSIDAMYGLNVDRKTHVTVSAHYSENVPLTIGDRTFMSDRAQLIYRRYPAYFTNSVFAPGATPNIGLSPATITAATLYNVPGAATSANTSTTTLILKDGTPLNSTLTYVPYGTSSATPAATLAGQLLANAGKQNMDIANSTFAFGRQNFASYAERTHQAGLSLRRQVTPWLEATADVTTDTDISYTMFNPFTQSITVPAIAPVNPFKNNVTLSLPLAIRGPDRDSQVDHMLSVSLKANLPHGWRGLLDYTWSINDFTVNYDYADLAHVYKDLLAGTLNPFVDTLDNPPDMTKYLAPASNSAQSTMNDLQARFSGPVWHFPWGAANLTVGGEHRKEGNKDNVYYNNGYGPNYPFGSIMTNLGQAQSNDAVFAEAEIPVVTQRNARKFLRTLDFQVAYRTEVYHTGTGAQYMFYYPNYNGPGNSYTTAFPALVNGALPPRARITYKQGNPTVGMRFEAVKDLMFRGSWSKGFLPPSYSQLAPGAPSNAAPTQITDPVLAQTYNVPTLSGGNPALTPQHSVSWNGGAIYQPREGLLRGLRFDAEFSKIQQDNYIVSPTAQQLIAFESLYPGRVTRDPTTNRITFINTAYTNATRYVTTLWNYTLDYRRETPIGAFQLHSAMTIFMHDKRQIAIGTPVGDLVGWANSTGEVKSRANGTLTWEAGRWTVGWTTTYYHSYHQLLQLGDPQYYYPGSIYYTLYPNGYPFYTLAQGGNGTIPAQVYHDAFVRYAFPRIAQAGNESRWRQILAGTEVQFGVKNLFNSVPPFDAAASPYFYAANSAQLRLRDFWVSIRQSF